MTLICLLILLLLQGFRVIHFSDTVMVSVIGTTTLQVFYSFRIVAKYFFIHTEDSKKKQ